MNPKDLPICCHAPHNAEPAHRLYAAYNAAGDPTTAGRNYQGQACPVFGDLPENIKEKWRAVAAAATRLVIDGYDAALS